MERMWMVRAEGGTLYDLFRERGVAAVGWAELAAKARPGMTRQQLVEIYRQAEPQAKQGTALAGASQVWRFINEVKDGDHVVTYSPGNRTYMIGKIAGKAEYKPEWQEDGMALARAVKWFATEIERDGLTTASKNSLGSTLTVFLVPESAMLELKAALTGKPVIEALPNDVDDKEIAEPLKDIEARAFEGVKDQVSQLGWDDMEKLVAGVLRAMGYKTRFTPSGGDRGRDIIASPDGLGFDNPRILVEVKHRKGRIGADQLRSFIAGCHRDDRGLYVSTGGFSKEAHYEADRAQIRMMLWTLDDLVRNLMDHYQTADIETRRLVPLKWAYWPA